MSSGIAQWLEHCCFKTRAINFSVTVDITMFLNNLLIDHEEYSTQFETMKASTLLLQVAVYTKVQKGMNSSHTVTCIWISGGHLDTSHTVTYLASGGYQDA